MALAPRLDLRHTQTLVMTPQLQQAIKLLQLSNIELAHYIEDQIESNPLLERDEGSGAEAEAETSFGDDNPASPTAMDSVQALDEAIADESGYTLGDAIDAQREDLFSGESDFDAASSGSALGSEQTSSLSKKSQGTDETDSYLESTLSRRISLREHLLQQLSIDINDAVERIIGRYLIEILDESGYLTTDVQEICAQLGCDEALVLNTLHKLQRFDPAGIFARSLAECLSIQLCERNKLTDQMQRLLDNLGLLGAGQLDALSKICRVPIGELRQMINEIRSLDPKPALAFDDVVAHPITPDVIMRAHPNGGWILELNSDSLPRVIVNNRYCAHVNEKQMTRTERSYINQCLQTANWLVRALHQRATTILNVSSEIVRQQEEFFRRGVAHLRPLVLRDIANAVELHESTVSRVTSNKYISTPRGIFELKYFFSQAVGGTGPGSVHSAEAVRHRIRGLIDGESADCVLSDDAIVDLLQSEGIEIARRTVAKYRESMGLASSVHRRRRRMAGV